MTCQPAVWKCGREEGDAGCRNAGWRVVYIYLGSHVPNIKTQWRDLRVERSIIVVVFLILIEAGAKHDYHLENRHRC